MLFLLLHLQSYGQSSAITADQLFEEAEKHLLYGRHYESVEDLENAAILYQQAENWERLVQCKNKISENLSAQFELEKAEKAVNEALSLVEQYLTPNHLEEASAINNLGNIMYLKGQHEKALEKFEEAHVVYELPENKGKHLYAAPTNLGIGNVYYGKNKYAEAFGYFKEALESNKKMLGDDHPYVANSYLSLGNLYRNKGSYNLARENYDKALQINKDYFGENHPDVATTYVGIADINKSSGDFALAMQYYRQAEHIYQEFFKLENPKFGAIYLGYADIYKNRGNYDDALKYYEASKDLFTKTIGKLNQSYVRANLGIGNTYLYQEKFLEALDFYNRVLDVNFNLVGEEHVNTSAAYNNLGSLNYFNGQFDLATKLFNKSLDIAIKIHGNDHPNVANAYYNLARVYGELGRTDLALANVQEAINSSIIDFDNSNVFVNPALLNYFDDKDLLWYLSYKGETLKDGFQGKSNIKGLDIALNSFILSDSLLQQITDSYTDKKDMVELRVFARSIYNSAIDVCNSLINDLNPQNVKQIGQEAVFENKLLEYQSWFLNFTEKNKAAILFSSLAESNAKSFGGIPDSLIANETDLKEKINKYTQELSANPDSLMQVHYQKKLFRVNRQYEDLITEYEENYPKYYDLKYNKKIVTIDELKDFLTDSSMIISYHIMEDSMFVHYIAKDINEIHKVEKSYDYDKLIAGLRNSIIYKYKPFYIKAASRLYRQLFPGTIPNNIKNLHLVMDGLMGTIPFETLLTERVMDNTNYKDLPYLIRRYNISYTYAANLLYNTFRNEKILQRKASKSLLAMAPVYFNSDYSGSFSALNELERGISTPDANLTLNKNKLSLDSLPGTEAEINMIDSLFNHLQEINGPSEVLVFEHAKEARIKENDIKDFKYLHIASHGFVDQENPARSGIFLSKDAKDSIEDGVLFSGEIYNLGVNSELITLSACETGRGKLSQGEGIVGLSQALIFAGAKNITVSLWKVSDQATSSLMSMYYKDFAQKAVPTLKTESLDYAPSLRKAKLSLINTDQLSLPYFWSPFILIGK